MTRLAPFAWFVVAVWLAAGIWRLSGRPMITLTTPTQTVIKQYTGLPPPPGLSEPTR